MTIREESIHGAHGTNSMCIYIAIFDDQVNFRQH
jgi:hypothetical protein